MPEVRLYAGEFSREDNVSLDEPKLVAALLADMPPGVVIDVGAHHGGASKHFLERGWRSHAFEPDPNNRAVLERLWGGHPGILIDPRAVGNEEALAVPFYASDESSGISALNAFTDGHRRIGEVDVVTLRRIVEEREISSVEFFKIDTEGHDLFVLQGFPWERLRPDVALCEFDDAKTLALGYNVHDICDFLTERGYSLLISEWRPILRYGVRHHFRRLVSYPVTMDEPGAWGNVLAFREPPDEQRLLACLSDML